MFKLISTKEFKQLAATIKETIVESEKNHARAEKIIESVEQMVKEIDPLREKIRQLEASNESHKKANLELMHDAELGKIAMHYVDRAGDVHPGIDDAETICAEFSAAMGAYIDANFGVKVADVNDT